MSVEQNRHAEVAKTIARVRAICGSGDMSRDKLGQIEEVLLELAAREDLFPDSEFGIPTDEKIRLYRLAEDPDGGFALYLHAANVPAEVAPHNHATWAAIAGIGGEETNFLYERTNGDAPVLTGQRPIRKGESISLMPDDVHSIRAGGTEPLKNLHLYGLAMEKLHDREFWDAERAVWTRVPPTSGIIERRSA